MGYIATVVIPIFILLSVSNVKADIESVNSPFYGEVLFDFYQKNYFTSITNLETGKIKDRLGSDAGQSEYLRGGLYLSYGLHREAEKIFEENSVRKNINHDHAIFMLGKIQFQRGYFDKSKSNLLAINNKLEENLEDERNTMLALIEVHNKNYDDAIKILNTGSSNVSINYAKYNLSVIMMAQGNENEAIKILKSMSDISMETEEIAALIDKTNLVLASYYLEKEKFKEASDYFSKIRVQGPSSNKALLGMGWSYIGLKEYSEAVSVWKELVRRETIDPSVLEAFLAIPYGYYLQGSNKQALNAYKHAIDVYLKKSREISIKLDENNFLISTDFQAHEINQSILGRSWQSEIFPEGLLNSYMLGMLSSHEFQEGLQNYRDLTFIQSSLKKWLNQLPVYEDMLEIRQASYESLVPKVKLRLEQLDGSNLAGRLMARKQEINDIDQNDRVMELVSDKERDSLIILEDIDSKLQKISLHQDITAQIRKHNFLRGLLIWDIHTNFKQRLWELNKNYAKLEQEYQLSIDNRSSLKASLSSAALDFSLYKERIQFNQSRINRSLENVSALIRLQAEHLNKLIKNELESVIKNIDIYRSQAMLSVAHILDSEMPPSEVVE